MRKIILLIAITVTTLPALKGQHCGWDNAYVIIVDVRDSATGQIIDDLEILLADSVGKPYRSEFNLQNFKELSFSQNTDTLRFGQNLKKETQEFSKINGPFPFGIGYYMLLVYYNNYPDFNKSGNDLILIRDKDGVKNLGSFESKNVKIGKENIVHLCTGESIWHHEESVNKVKIMVALKQ